MRAQGRSYLEGVWWGGGVGNILEVRILVRIFRQDSKTRSTKSERELSNTEKKNNISAKGPVRVKGTRGQKDLCSPHRKYD